MTCYVSWDKVQVGNHQHLYADPSLPVWDEEEEEEDDDEEEELEDYIRDMGSCLS